MILNKNDWAKADAIARELASDVDRNELGKVVAYAHRVRNTRKIIDLTARLASSGYARSGRTRSYLGRIASVLRRQLAGLDNERAITVLAWAFRMMTTYQTECGTRTAATRPEGKSRR